MKPLLTTSWVGLIVTLVACADQPDKSRRAHFARSSEPASLIDHLKQIGANVVRDPVSGCVVELNLDCPHVDDATFADLKQLKHLKRLYAGWTGLTDSNLSFAEHLPDLRVLVLTNDPITDAGLRHLRNANRLEEYLNPNPDNKTCTGLPVP
jgi:hypothetical protein